MIHDIYLTFNKKFMFVTEFEWAQGLGVVLALEQTGLVPE